MAVRDTALRYIVGGRSFLDLPKGAVTIVTSRSCISARPIDADWPSRGADSESKTRRVRGFPGTPCSEKSSNHLEGARYASPGRNNDDLNFAAFRPEKFLA